MQLLKRKELGTHNAIPVRSLKASKHDVKIYERWPSNTCLYR